MTKYVFDWKNKCQSWFMNENLKNDFVDQYDKFMIAFDNITTWSITRKTCYKYWELFELRQMNEVDNRCISDINVIFVFSKINIKQKHLIDDFKSLISQTLFRFSLIEFCCDWFWRHNFFLEISFFRNNVMNKLFTVKNSVFIIYSLILTILNYFFSYQQFEKLKLNVYKSKIYQKYSNFSKIIKKTRYFMQKMQQISMKICQNNK